MISLEELKLHVEYNPETGEMFRVGTRDRYGNYSKIDKYLITGKTRQDRYGYFRVSINGKRYLVHKLAYHLSTGIWADTIDHQDGDCGNNKLCNLRATDRTGNMTNLKLRIDNPTGYVGVAVKDGKFYAHAQRDGVRLFEGYFDKIEDAIAARSEMNVKLGFHDNHGGVR